METQPETETMTEQRKQWGVTVSGVIAQRDWCKKKAKQPGESGRKFFNSYRRLDKLLHRFESGERSDRLYDAMTSRGA